MPVFNGTSKMVQNKLLECTLAVVRERIVVEVKSASYLAIQADETTDVSTQTQLVPVLRYIDDNHAVQERFLEFIPISDSTSVSIASVLLERLNQLLADDNNKRRLVCSKRCVNILRMPIMCIAMHISLITSAKEVMFSPEFVCLSVGNIT